MNDWEKFNETSLPEREKFCNHLNMADITDADYTHAKRVCKDVEIKNLGEYQDLYVQSDTLLLVDVLRTFETCVLKYMDLTLIVFYCSRFSMASSLLPDMDILLMVEKGIRGRICHERL